jgi:outer membrane biosynthesis protein TonB
MSDKAPSPEATPAKEPTPAPAEADAEPEVEEEVTETKPESTTKPTSSNKKTARPAKPRASIGGASKKAGNGTASASGERSFSVGDIVLARLKGYPPWRECYSWRMGKRANICGLDSC